MAINFVDCNIFHHLCLLHLDSVLSFFYLCSLCHSCTISPENLVFLFLQLETSPKICSDNGDEIDLPNTCICLVWHCTLILGEVSVLVTSWLLFMSFLSVSSSTSGHARIPSSVCISFFFSKHPSALASFPVLPPA